MSVGPSSVCSSRVSHETPVGVSTGPRQPWSAHAREKGVNTLYGSPEPLRTRPGATAYGEPVRTSSMPASARAFSTSSSRREPVVACTAFAARTTRRTGSPRTTDSCVRRWRSEASSERSDAPR